MDAGEDMRRSAEGSAGGHNHVDGAGVPGQRAPLAPQRSPVYAEALATLAGSQGWREGLRDLQELLKALAVHARVTDAVELANRSEEWYDRIAEMLRQAELDAAASAD